VTDESLRDVAELARANAYAPYSQFRVGAALRADDGRIFAGANVENGAYGLGICAERSAVAAAVSAGARAFDALALVSDSEAPASPCGACRQVLAEFAPALRVTSYGQNGEVAEWTMDELLPHRFRLHDSDGTTT
jgi:cytidine deaminase